MIFKFQVLSIAHYVEGVREVEDFSDLGGCENGG